MKYLKKTFTVPYCGKLYRDNWSSTFNRRSRMLVKYIKLSPCAVDPERKTPGSSGLDLCAGYINVSLIRPHEILVVPTGIAVEIPLGLEGQVRPRSGLASKYGITIVNSPGTIDADYRGEIKIPLINLSDEDYWIEPGERIAQIVIAPVSHIPWELCRELSPTERGNNGFGSTGKGGTK